MRNVITVGCKLPGCLTWEEALQRASAVPLQEVYRLAASLASEGHALMVSLHDLRAAYRFPRVLVLDRGRLVGDGPPHAVLTAALLREVFRVEATFVESLVPELPA